MDPLLSLRLVLRRHSGLPVFVLAVCIASLSSPLLAQRDMRGNEAYMICCNTLVKVPGGDWAMADRSIDCDEYLEKKPEVRCEVCSQLTGKMKVEQTENRSDPDFPTPCIEICGQPKDFCATCPQGDLCDLLIRTRAGILTGIPPGNERVTVETLKRLKKTWKEIADKAVKGNFKQKAEQNLKEIRNELCLDATQKAAIDKALASLANLKVPPGSPSDTVANIAILKSIEKTLLSLMGSHCQVPAAQGPCPVGPLPEVPAEEENQGEPECNKPRSSITETKLAGTPMAKALQCLRELAGDIDLCVKLNSGYRSTAYQEHFRKIVEGYLKLLRNRNPACDAIRKVYEEEMARHQLLGPIADPKGGAKHPENKAIDIQVPKDVEGQAPFISLAACCNLWQRYGQDDKVHFELCTPEIGCNPAEVAELCPPALRPDEEDIDD